MDDIIDLHIAQAKASIELEGLEVKVEYVDLVKQRQHGIITKEGFLIKIKELIG